MSNDRPRVSIGMPVYNGERFIREALDSILAQTFRDFELIISDNASTDGTEEICRTYASYDGRIRYSRNGTNLGAARNFNHTFEVSSGEYFKWAAHDDVLARDYLDRCVDMLDTAPRAVVLCFPRRVFIDTEGRAVRSCDFRPSSRKLHEQNGLRILPFGELVCLPHSCVPAIVFGLMRTSALRKTRLIGGFVASDLVLVAEMALLGSLWQIPERLFYQRLHERTSWRANLSRRAEAAWFAPENERRMFIFPLWRLIAEYVFSIGHSELNRIDKVRHCLQLRGFLLRCLWRQLARIGWLAWSRVSGCAARVSRYTCFPLRVWALLRLIRRKHRWRLGRAIAEALGATETQLLTDAAQALDDRGDAFSRKILARLLTNSSESLRLAAASALAQRPVEHIDALRNRLRRETSRTVGSVLATGLVKCTGSENQAVLADAVRRGVLDRESTDRVVTYLRTQPADESTTVEQATERSASAAP